MNNFSFERARAGQARKAREETRTTRETPENESAEAQVDAASTLRKWQIEAHEPGEPSVQEIIVKHSTLFTDFLKKEHSIDLDQGLKPGQVEGMAAARVEFLDRYRHAEYVKGLVTPELISELVTTGFINDDLTFKTMVDTMGGPKMAAILQDRMIALAFSNKDRFESLARSVEVGATYRDSSYVKKLEQEMAILQKKYRISDEDYARLTSEDATFEDFQDQVRKSKGKLFGWMQKGLDEDLESFRSAVPQIRSRMSLADQAIAEHKEQIRLREAALSSLEQHAQENEADEGHFSHRKLAAALALLSNMDAELDEKQKERKKLVDELRRVEEAIAIHEKFSSEGGAARLEETVPEVQGVLDQLDGYSGDIVRAMRGVFAEDPEVLKAVTAAYTGKSELAPAKTRAEQLSSAAAAGEEARYLDTLVPSENLFQEQYDRHVISHRAITPSASRAELRSGFVRETSERLKREYRGGPKPGRKGFFASFFAAFFGGGEVDQRISQRALSLT